VVVGLVVDSGLTFCCFFWFWFLSPWHDWTGGKDLEGSTRGSASIGISNSDLAHVGGPQCPGYVPFFCFSQSEGFWSMCDLLFSIISVTLGIFKDCGEEGETASGIAGRITTEVLGGEQTEWFRYPGDVEGEEGKELEKTLARRTRLAIGVLAECGENTVSGWWWLVGWLVGWLVVIVVVVVVLVVVVVGGVWLWCEMDHLYTRTTD